MRSPFIFHRIVTGDNFVGRDKEINKLMNNFRDGVNTFVISPRRTGKTSLVSHASELFCAKQKKRETPMFVFINLWNIRTETEFYELFANQVLKAASSHFKEVVDNTKAFLSNLKPTIDLEYESIKLKVDFNIQKKEIEDVLNLPQNIAEKKKREVIICLDEFQDIEHFKDSLSFQKRIRSHWQEQQNVNYILYGSKRHMLTNLFNNSSMPFYRFGDVLYLKKIDKQKLVNFIIDKFQKTKKLIRAEDARFITEILAQHPYYIQQFCNVLWQNTVKNVTKDVLKRAMIEFIEYNAGQFEILLKNLSNSQINFLKAMLDGVESFHAQNILQKYQLGSSANVTSVKKALIEKEIVDNTEGLYAFSDPVFEVYLRLTYKKQLPEFLQQLW